MVSAADRKPRGTSRGCRSLVGLPAVTVVVFDNSLVGRSGVEELSAELHGSLLDRPEFAPFNLAFSWHRRLW